MVLVRRTLDHRAQGTKLGVSLPQDAVGRSVSVSRHAGVRALRVAFDPERGSELALSP